MDSYEMIPVEVGSGILGLHSEGAEALLDSLIQEGRFWEYMTEIFNYSVDHYDELRKSSYSKVEDNPENMDKMQKQIDALLEMVTKMNETQQVLVNRPVTVVASDDTAKPSIPVKPKEPAKAKTVSKKPKKGFGGFAAMAKQYKGSD